MLWIYVNTDEEYEALFSKYLSNASDTVRCHMQITSHWVCTRKRAHEGVCIGHNSEEIKFNATQEEHDRLLGRLPDPMTEEQRREVILRMLGVT